jgi:hypothetical protein
MMKINFACTILAAAMLNGCDSGSLTTKSLSSDKRSGIRASDLKSSDAEVETASAEAPSTEFKISIQGELPESGSGAAEYELFVVSPVADTYHSVILDGEADCEFDESVTVSPTSTPISFEVHEQKSYVLCVRAYNLEGAPSEVFSHRWTLDLKKPSLTVFNVPSEPTGQIELSFLVTSQQAGAYVYALNNGEKSCADETYSAEIALSEPIIAKAATAGKKQICVKSVDLFGVQSDIFEKTWTYSDAIPNMILTGLPTPITTLNETTVLIAADSKVQNYQYNILQGQSDCTAAAFGGLLPITTEIKSNLGLPGINTLCIKGQDVAGKTSGIFSYSWIFDNIKRDMVLTGLPEVEDPAEKLNIRIAGANIKEYKYVVLREDNAQCGNIKYSKLRDVAVAIEDNISIGGYTLCVVGKDSSGAFAAPARFAWTRIKMPLVRIEAVSGLPTTITNQKNFPSIAIVGFNAETYKFGLKAGAAECADVALTLGTGLDPFALNPATITTNGLYTICLLGIGHFKQLSEFKKYQFTFDNTPPVTPTFTDLPIGSVKTTLGTMTVTPAGDGALEYVFVRKTGGVATCNAVPESLVRLAIATPLDTATQGLFTLCLWTFDGANNFSPAATVRWELDMINPVQKNITQVVNATTVDATVSISNVEPSVAKVRYRFYFQTALTAAILACDDPVTLAATYTGGPAALTVIQSITKPATGETTRLCVFVEDGAGNKSLSKDSDVTTP